MRLRSFDFHIHLMEPTDHFFPCSLPFLNIRYIMLHVYYSCSSYSSYLIFIQVKTYPNAFKPETPVYIKLSGDGAKFSRSSNYILLSFSFLSCNTDVLSGSGKEIE